jgi:hypothetical protein
MYISILIEIFDLIFWLNQLSRLKLPCNFSSLFFKIILS